MTRWIEELSTALNAIGTSLPVATGGFIGALLSMRFLGPSASILFRMVMVVCGFSASVILTPLAVYLLGIHEINVMSGVAFILGLYGMSLVSEGNELIKSGALRETINGWFRKGNNGGGGEGGG